MDFINNAASAEKLMERVEGLTGKSSSSNEKTESNQQSEGNQKTESTGQSNSSSGGQYDKYISQGIAYAQEKFQHADAKNLTESQKSQNEKATAFISKEVESFLKKDSK